MSKIAVKVGHEVYPSTVAVAEHFKVSRWSVRMILSRHTDEYIRESLLIAAADHKVRVTVAGDELVFDSREEVAIFFNTSKSTVWRLSRKYRPEIFGNKLQEIKLTKTLGKMCDTDCCTTRLGVGSKKIFCRECIKVRKAQVLMRRDESKEATRKRNIGKGRKVKTDQRISERQFDLRNERYCECSKCNNYHNGKPISCLDKAVFHEFEFDVNRSKCFTPFIKKELGSGLKSGGGICNLNRY